ncbi:hypothetical protein OK351_01320 [Glutamicibacter sp. MNS18]|uniref:hypothetical protein n=1 Tax=Glutamicibacter sp. MNS18 TaxID=2989817 RepID=UPI002235E006|nr:hypothetical protein [Glutamicibacter sp. MNS18]MCW4464153.1 hypothetical protein [Glutamicibacter sp. MNS18]
MGYIVLGLLTAIVGYLIGVRRGRKDATNATLLGQAWQRGYDSSTEYWTSRMAGSQAAPPGQAPGVEPAPASQPPPDAPPSTADLQDRDQPVDVPSAVSTVPPGTPAPAGLPFMRGPQSSEQQGTGTVDTGWREPVGHLKPDLTPRERELRNINITLYVAALLLVAAGALFLSFALAPVAKLVGLCLVAASFYAAGLVVHRVKHTLQPAAAAFTGTGLALLPLCAIATYNTLGISGAGTWWIFSLLATLAFGYATIALRSRVLAWLAILILISTAMSSAAALQQGVLTYLVALLGLSVLLQLLIVRSGRVRQSLFHTAMAASITVLPPLVFLAAMVMIFELGARDAFWIFLLLSAHYLLATRLHTRRRALHFAAARLFFVLALVAAMAYLDLAVEPAVVVIILVLVGQAAVLTRSGERYRRLFSVGMVWSQSERGILWALGVLLTAGLYLRDGAGMPGTWWVTLLLIPALMGVLIWVSSTGGRLEPLVLLVLAGTANLETVETWWRPLPALLLAVAGLGLVCRRPPETLARAAAAMRWVLLLVIGMKLGQSVHVLAGGADQRLLLPGLVGLWAVACLMLVRTAAVLRRELKPGPARHHLLGRVGAGFVLLLLLAAVTRADAMFLHPGDSFLTLGSALWGVLILIGGVLAVAYTGWHHEYGAGKGVDHYLRLAVLATLLVFFLLALRTDYWWLAAVVAALNLAFLAVALPRVDDGRWKIAYAAVAQVHFTGAIWWTVHQFALDVHGQLAVLLLSLLLPQGTRLLPALRGARGPGRELEAITLGLLGLVPLLLAGYALELRWADRGTVLLGLASWIGYGLLAHRALAAKTYRQWLLLPAVLGGVALAMVPAASMNPGTGWIRSPLWGESTVLWLLVLQLVAAAGGEYLRRNRTSHRQLQLVALSVPWAVLIGYQSSQGWLAFVLLLAAVCCALLVHTRSLAWSAVPAAGLLLAAAYTGWRTLSAHGPLGPDRSLDLSWSMLAGALALLVVSLLHGRFTEPLPGYPLALTTSPHAVGQAARIYYAAMLFAGALAGATAHLLHSGYLPVLGGAGVLLLALLVVRLHELPRAWAPHGTDVLLVITSLLVLRSYTVLEREPAASSAILYLAAVAAGIAVRHLKTGSGLTTGWMVAAAVLASAAELATIADAGAVVQMLVLVFFAGLLAFGLVRGQKLFIWWAAIAITAAVLWFLRNYAFLLLAFLAAGLIVLAVVKLLKVEKTPK